MPLKRLAKDTTAALLAAVSDHDFSEAQKTDIAAIVEDSLAKAVEQAQAVHHEATVMCCGPEADMAHKIGWEAKQRTELLISNLSSSR